MQLQSGRDVSGLRSRRRSVLVFFVTIWLVLRGPRPSQTRVGPTLGLLRYYFPGYEVSVLGSFIGFFYGALAGALIRLGHRRCLQFGRRLQAR